LASTFGIVTNAQLTTRVGQAGPMYFVGLDLAWGERNPTGVAVVDDKGALVQVSAQTDDASILAAIRPYVADDCVVGIDAPLIVTNPKGNRSCEAALNKDFAKFQAGAHP